MKPRVINENPGWTFVVPDSVADWDGPSHWERERLASMQANLHPGEVLFDIGVEHGWLSTVYGSFVGHENMVLVEPSPEMWPDIRKTWAANQFPDPLYAFVGFAGAHNIDDPKVAMRSVKGKRSVKFAWPECARLEGPESGPMAYRIMGKHTEVPVTTVDRIVELTGIIPNALTIDVEGAEWEVLRGAHDTLVTHRPKLWVSVHPDLMEKDFNPRPDGEPFLIEEFFAWVESHSYKRVYLGTDHEQHHVFWPIEQLANYVPLGHVEGSKS